MTVVSGYDCANDRIVSNRDKEKLIVNCDLLINDLTGIVVCRLVAEDCLR